MDPDTLAYKTSGECGRPHVANCLPSRHRLPSNICAEENAPTWHILGQTARPALDFVLLLMQHERSYLNSNYLNSNYVRFKLRGDGSFGRNVVRGQLAVVTAHRQECHRVCYRIKTAKSRVRPCLVCEKI